ncbi:MAG: stage II sporulation protein E [Bacillota bacterium]
MLNRISLPHSFSLGPARQKGSHANTTRTAAAKIDWRRLLSREALVLAGLTFLLTRATLIGELNPFVLTFMVVAVRDQRNRIGLMTAAALISSALGGVSSLGQVLGIAMAAGALAASGSWSIWRVHDKLALPLISCGLHLVARIPSLLINSPTSYDLLVVAFEAALAFVLAHVYSLALPYLFGKKRVVSYEELMAVSVLTASVLVGLTGLKLGPLSVKNMTARYLIMLMASTGGTGLGTMAGAVVGAVTEIAAGLSLGTVGLYACSGLISGLFKDYTRVGVAIGFAAPLLLLAVYTYPTSQIMVVVGETVIAAALFILTPQRPINALGRIVAGIAQPSAGSMSERGEGDSRLQRMASQRLKDCARVFFELARTFENNDQNPQLSHEQKLNQLFGTVTDRVCDSCQHFGNCWGNGFYRTYQSMFDLWSIVEAQGSVNEHQVPDSIRERCRRLPQLTATINQLSDAFRVHWYWQKRVAESRNLVANQLRGMANVVKGLASEIRLDVRFNEELAEQIKRELSSQGCLISSITAAQNASGQSLICVEKTSCYGRKECQYTILPAVERAVGQRVYIQDQQCTSSTGKPRCSFNLALANSFYLDTAVVQIPKEDNVVSGDSFTSLELKNGQFAMVLSDGMGNGPRANNESQTTVSMMEQMLAAGFDQETAIRTINSVLVLRSTEETFATVDLSMVNLHSGEAEFLKIGAAPSFIKHGGVVRTVKSSTLPIGILSNVEMESSKYQLEPGDFVIMVTDGVLDGQTDYGKKEEWIVKLLRTTQASDAQQLADELMNRARGIIGGRALDDMTILVAQVALRDLH